MSATSGKIEPLMLFKVFRSMLDRRLSGVLTVQRGQVMKKARFANGLAVQVASNRPEESLAHALVDEGLISSTERVELEAARRIDPQSFEALVRDRGLVSPERLDTIERRLARRRLLEAFGWPDGTFAFEPGTVRTPPQQHSIDTIALLLDAAARVLPTPICERFVGGYPGQQLRLTEFANTYAAAYDAAFSPPNLRGLLVRPIAISGVGALPGDGARNMREAAALVLSGLGTLERSDASGRATAVAAPSAAASAPPSASRSPARPPAPPAAAPAAAAAGPSEPPPGPMRRAIRSVPPAPAAVAPHPTRSDPPKPRRNPLGSSGPSSEPSAVGSPSAGPPVRMRGAEPSGVAGATRTAAAKPAGASSGEPKGAQPSGSQPIPDKIRAKLDEAQRLAATADAKTHYEILGVPPTADEAAIRTAFRKLARDFHADLFARYGLEKHVQSAVQKVFIAINRAHETLSDAARRTEYDISIEMKAAGGRPGSPGGGAPQVDQVFKAEKLIKDATVLISRGEAEPAIERLRQALAVSSEDPVAQAALAFAEHLVAQTHGGSQVVLRRALETVEAICSEVDNREEPFLYLGRLYGAIGDQDKAIRAIEQALRINPHYAEAGSELRHMQRKAEQTKSGGLAGLFGRRKK